MNLSIYKIMVIPFDAQLNFYKLLNDYLLIDILVLLKIGLK